MTDALPPEQRSKADAAQPDDQAASSVPARKGKGKPRARARAKALEAEQIREARESAQARNAEASTRDRMVDIGRGTQQAGRQRAK